MCDGECFWSLGRPTCVFIEGKMFQNLRVSSPAPVTIVCVNMETRIISHVSKNIFLERLLLLHSEKDLPAHPVTLQGKAHAMYVQSELRPVI